MNEFRRGRFGSRAAKILLIAVLVLSITFLHYFTALGDHYYHIFYRLLYFIPVMLAGFWFGLRGALLTSLTVTVAYSPYIFLYWHGFSATDFDKVMEVLLYNGVAVIAGVLRDREKAEQKRLREAEKLAAMGKALSGVAHDMKTPLIAIGGFSNLVLKKLKQTDLSSQEDLAEVVQTCEEKLDIVINETRRLENMLKEMLDFSKPLQLQRSLIQMRGILQETVLLLQELANQQQVSVIWACADDLPEVSADVMRIKQVLINLLANAIQASPEGEEVKVHCHVQGEHLVIDVADCGSGIPVEKRMDVFTPFFTTKQDGTGLGLPIVKKIVDAHEGEIEILDNTQRGITFRVRIPHA